LWLRYQKRSFGGKIKPPNQALKQARDGVLRYGERVGYELLHFFVLYDP
jgi:hypothetical protein